MRQGKLTEKDMSVLREGLGTRAQLQETSATVRDYSLKHRVTVDWDLSEEAKRDQMIRLSIDDYEVILDAEELMRYIRWC